MPKLFIALFALLLTGAGISGHSTSPVRAARDSGSIVWILRRGSEQAPILAKSTRPSRRRVAAISGYRPLLASRDRIYALFQRPPPTAA